MRVTRAIGAMLLGVAVPSLAAGQGRPLTLEAAVQVALDKNPVVRAAQEGLVAAEATVGEMRAPYRPELSLVAGYAGRETHAFLPSGLPIPSTTIGPTNDWTAALAGRYTLVDHDERAARLRAAMAGRDVATDEATRIRADLALNVEQAFLGLVAALDSRRVAETTLARVAEHLRLAEARRAAGAVSGADVIQAQVEVADARLSLVRVDSLIRLARGQLNTAMGLPVETAVEVVAPETPPTPPDQIALADAMAQATSARPDVKAAQGRIAVAGGLVDATRSALGPRVDADWSFGWRDSDFPADRDWRVGVGVRWTLFDGGARRARIARAHAELAAKEADADRLAQQVRHDVWSAHSRLTEAWEAIRATDALVRDAEEGVRVATERYRLGAGTVNELLDAQAALTRASAIRVQTQWDYQSARAEYDWATGKIGS